MMQAGSPGAGKSQHMWNFPIYWRHTAEVMLSTFSLVLWLKWHVSEGHFRIGSPAWELGEQTLNCILFLFYMLLSFHWERQQAKRLSGMLSMKVIYSPLPESQCFWGDAFSFLHCPYILLNSMCIWGWKGSKEIIVDIEKDGWTQREWLQQGKEGEELRRWPWNR